MKKLFATIVISLMASVSFAQFHTPSINARPLSINIYNTTNSKTEILSGHFKEHSTTSNHSYGTKGNDCLGSSQTSNSYYVYKTPYGQKYHRYNCRYARGKDLTKMSVRVAQSMGLDPCKICKP